MNLRRDWLDEDFMRGHLKVAGITIKFNQEPATVERMKFKLRVVGVHSLEVQAAVGMPLARFLEVCRRRTNIEPPCRSNIEPGRDAVRRTCVCG